MGAIEQSVLLQLLACTSFACGFVGVWRHERHYGPIVQLPFGVAGGALAAAAVVFPIILLVRAIT